MTIRFLHTSDWQLGMTRRFMSDEAAARFSQDRINAIKQLGILMRLTPARIVSTQGGVPLIIDDAMTAR